jgi:hypothetical protein
MKMIHCDLCGDDKVLLATKYQSCECGNIGGQYQENRVYADIYLKNEKSFASSRVVGVTNGVMTGIQKRGVCHVGEWAGYQLRIFVDGVERKYEDIKMPVIPFEEYAELMARVMEKGGYTPEDIESSKEKSNGNVVYNLKDGAKIVLFRERPDVKEPIVVMMRIEDDFMVETKIFAYMMRD